MSLRNKATILMLDQIDTVRACFDAKYVEGLTKLYTYKVKKGYVQAGDLALVLDTQNRFKVVQVVSVDDTPNIDVNSAFDYKWLVQRIDTTTYDKCITAENELMYWKAKATKTVKKL